MAATKSLKIFISQPMYGRSKEEIETERNLIIDKFEEFALASKWVSPGDTIKDVNYMYDEPGPTPNPNRIWYLGRSIQKLSTADFVVFACGWQEANGCCVENAVARHYFQYSVDMMKRRFKTNSVYVNNTPMSISPLDPIDEIWWGRNA